MIPDFLHIQFGNKENNQITLMKVTIEIECDTAGQLEQHLNEIISTVKVRSKNDPSCEFEVGTAFTHFNCNGNYDVIIENN